MRAIVIHRFGGADVVVEEERPRPEPGPDDLLVAVRAASVNPVDFKIREGLRDLDLVFDTQGGATLERSFAVVRRGGIVVTIGGKPDATLAREWGLNPLLGLALRFTMRKVTRLARQSHAHFEYLFVHPSGEQLARIAELLEHRVIAPVLDRTFALAEAKQALAYVESGRSVGKVVLRVS